MSKFGIEFLKNPSQLVVTSSDGVSKDPPDFQFRENGYLFVSSTPDGLRLLKENNRMQKECGVTWTHLMEPAAMAAKFPWLKTSDLSGGSCGTQNEGYFDPWSLLNALKSKVPIQLKPCFLRNELYDFVLFSAHLGDIARSDLSGGNSQRCCDGHVLR